MRSESFKKQKGCMKINHLLFRENRGENGRNAGLSLPSSPHQHDLLLLSHDYVIQSVPCKVCSSTNGLAKVQESSRIRQPFNTLQNSKRGEREDGWPQNLIFFKLKSDQIQTRSPSILDIFTTTHHQNIIVSII